MELAKTYTLARKLERERDELTNKMVANEAYQAGLLAERDESREQLKVMREAIKDAHYALAYVYNHGEGSCTFPYRTDDDLCSENRFHHVKDALDALKPFLKTKEILP